MGSTYLSLTNRLLKRLNDVEITQSDFPSVRNLQATAKDAIVDSVRHINNYRTNWPFNSEAGSQLLTVGQTEYDWPTEFANVDWDSFQIQKDDTLATRSRNLKYIPKDFWYSQLKDIDDDAGSEGRSVPEVVFMGSGSRFGVSPSPDQAYTVEYNYFKTPTDPVLFDDTVTIPTKFDYVIVAGAMYYMNQFKGDTESTDRIEAKLKEYLRDMVNQLLPNQDRAHVTRVNLGGGTKSTHMWTGR